MPTERKLLPGDIAFILAWARKWREIPTRKQIAARLGVSERTVARIVRDRGYPTRKTKLDIEALARSCDTKRAVPQVTAQNGTHQEAN